MAMKRISGLLVVVLLLVGLCACEQSTEAQWREQYDLGVRYLSEGNYEEAVIAFTAAIEQGDTLPDTAVLPKAEFPQAQQTEKLRVGTVPLADGTIPPVHDEDTVPLYDRATPPDGETEVLDSSMQTDGTEKLGVTTPLSDSQRK